MPLLPSQRLWVFEIIRSHGFAAEEFELVDGLRCRTGKHHPAVIHRASQAGYYFAFQLDQRRNGYSVEFSPGADTIVDGWGTTQWDGIVPEAFQNWLEYLRREIETPDVWAEVGNQRALLAGDNTDALNTLFTREEQTAIVQQLGEVKQLVREGHNLSANQFATLESRLDYLEGAVDRLGRVDWRNNLIGALIGLVLQHAIPIEPIQAAFGLLTRTIGHIIGMDGGPGLPPGDGGGGGYDVM